MDNITTLELQQSLMSFTDKLRFITKDNYNEQTKAALYKEYETIYYTFDTLSDVDILNSFSADQIKIINFLSLGLSNENKFNELLRNIEFDSANTAINVAKFIKSDAGYELLNKSEISELTDDEVVRLFGSLFGVHVAQECIVSLKAEKIGSIIGYALSGNCEKDLQEYQLLLKSNPDLKITDFLKQKIQESNFPFCFNFTNDAGTIITSAWIEETKHSSLLATRSSEKADSCHVNHDRKIIVLGFSYGGTLAANQGDSFAKAIIAAKELVKQEFINGVKNPYYGYAIEPFYYLNAPFSVNKENHENQKGRDFIKMMQGITSSQKNDLAVGQVWKLLVNTNSPDMANTLALYNFFIAGCDTYELYKEQQKLLLNGDALDGRTINKWLLKGMMKYIENTATIINTPSIAFNKAGQTILREDFLATLVDMCEKTFLNFPYKIQSDEYDQIVNPVYSTVTRLISTLKASAGGDNSSGLLWKLSKAIEPFKSASAYNKAIKESQEYVEKDQPIIWREQDIHNRKNYVSYSETAKDLFAAQDMINLILWRLRNGSELTAGVQYFEMLNLKLHNHIMSQILPNKTESNISQQKDVTREFAKQTKTVLDLLYDNNRDMEANFIKSSKFLFDSISVGIDAEKYNKKLGKLVNSEMVKYTTLYHHLLASADAFGKPQQIPPSIEGEVKRVVSWVNYRSSFVTPGSSRNNNPKP